MASGEPGDATSPGRAWWKSLATENLDVKALVLLAVLAVGCFVWGWFLRPPDGASTQVPSSPRLSIDFSQNPQLGGLDILSVLSQNKGSAAAELKINATAIGPARKTISWNMGVFGFVGHFCTISPYRNRETVVPLGGPNYQVTGTSRIPAIQNAPFIVVDLCWSSDPPLTVGDSYFSAALPRILVSNQAGTLTSVLELPGTPLFDYSPSGGVAPTGESQQAWSWTAALSSGFGSPGSVGVLVYGSNNSEIQHENHNAFYSGILFGVAGGAALSMLAALPTLIGRRNERRDASEEDGGSDATGRPATQAADNAPS